jgi:hypothetical protein
MHPIGSLLADSTQLLLLDPALPIRLGLPLMHLVLLQVVPQFLRRLRRIRSLGNIVHRFAACRTLAVPALRQQSLLT